MLTESFIASIRAGSKSAASSSLPKEAAIFLHDFQPLPALKGALKKSSTEPNCLAATSTHIFAAQSDKAIINVYNRERGNLETIVPFPFRITSLARIGAADGAAILVLGTESGGLLLWELFTGRLVSTEPSHLRTITSLAVTPTNAFLLSGSTDSSIQVWSIPGLLSFTDPGIGDSQASRGTPLLHLNAHRGPITSIITGHSHTNADFAISASEDKACLIWNYRSGAILHRFYVPETPLCVALDPADRGFYAGLSDGSVQFINFHKSGSNIHLLYNANAADTPTQAPESDRWRSATPVGAALSVSVSYDGTGVLSGHDTGKVLMWEIGRPPVEVADLGQSVTNLTIVPPTGFPNERKDAAGVRQISIIKPRPDAFPYVASSGLSVPPNYNFTANFAEAIPVPRFADADGKDTLVANFEAAISTEYLPEDLMRAAIAEVSGFEHGADAAAGESLTGEEHDRGSAEQEISRLKAQLKMAEFQKQKFADKLIEATGQIEKRDSVARMKERAKYARMGEEARARERRRKKQMGGKMPESAREADETGLSDVDSDENLGRT